MSKLLILKSNQGARKKKKRVGRGNGSGHGTYSTRGMNGQNARTGGGTRVGFEGGQTPLYRKMPKLKGFLNPNYVKFQVINLEKLNVFDDNEEVDVQKLHKKGLVRNTSQPLKVLGSGDLKKKLTVKADKFSASAQEKIEKAQGAAVVLKAEK